MHRRLFYAVALLALFLFLAIAHTWAADLPQPRLAPAHPQPPVVLWAWERPEDLRFLSAQHSPFGAAFLAETIYLRDSGVQVHPRMQPLRVNSSTPLIAVIRIESAAGAAAKLDSAQQAKLVDAIAAAARLPRVSSLQMDFDARRSELAFYKNLLTDVRNRLPHGITLSITALTSWCLEKDWINTLPIDDAVPMMFRMSADATYVRRYFAAYGGFPAAICNHSIGLSTDEPQPRFSGRQLYLFAPQPWSAKLLHQQRIALAGAQQ